MIIWSWTRIFMHTFQNIAHLLRQFFLATFGGRGAGSARRSVGQTGSKIVDSENLRLKRKFFSTFEWSLGRKKSHITENYALKICILNCRIWWALYFQILWNSWRFNNNPVIIIRSLTYCVSDDDWCQWSWPGWS